MENFINNVILPPVLKFVQTKAVNAIKNGMVLTMPFTIVGSIFLLLTNFPIPAVTQLIANLGLTDYFNQAFNASFGVMAYFAVMGIAIAYCRETGMNAVESIPAGFVALTNFFLLQNPTIQVTTDAAGNAIDPITVGNILDKTWSAGQGMFAAIVIGISTAIVYSWFIKRKVTIKMPDGVPENIAATFEAIIPAAVSITLTMIVYGFFDRVLGTTFLAWIFEVLQTPLQGLTGGLFGAIAIPFLFSFFWWFGVHGPNVVGSIMAPLLQANALQNQSIIDSGRELTIANGGRIVTQQFIDQFVTVTGSGMTLGLVLFMLVFAKSKQYKTLGRLSIVPGAFNINEPMLFGTPIVMNPIMAIPFIFGPIISALIVYFALYTGIVPLFTAVQVPWTTPPIISGFLVGGVPAMLLQIVCITAVAVIYFPFAKYMDIQQVQIEASGDAE
ncbi:MAG: PTS sugar transporter subunit IIC [Streptococcaceae bacterium]|jgi:PTS system cellobiose-specific IIC component|nr:PTS sugar transporter subunit IIC [Streptococcaceae bacterium]